MKQTNGTIYGSKDRPKFKIWDNEKNEWYKPTYEAYNGKVEDLSLSPSGELSMRTINEFAHESVFPYRFEVVMEVPKVVVPKSFDEWYSEIKNRFVYKESGKKFALWKICQFGFGYWLQDVNGENIDQEAEVSKWVSSNTMIAIDAVLNGYEVEKEPLYEVLLPYVRWSDKRSELVTDYLKLMFDKTSEETRFVWRGYVPVNNDYTCKLTESDIKEIDERYWPFAVLAND